MPASIPAGSTVLVTGATGFTGTVLTRKLVGAGLSVRAIARKTSNTDALSDLNINWIRGDVFDPDLVRSAMDGVEYVFHLATSYREARSTPETYRKVHVESTQLLAEAARLNPAFKRFVHTSTIGVHGHIEGEPANETHPFRPGDEYQETKAEADRWIREFSAQHGIPCTVIRPAGIFGPTDRRLFKLFKMASRRLFPLIGFGTCHYHLIHVDDLADAMILSANHPDADGQAFIIGNSEPIPLAEIARVIAGELGHPLHVIRAPAFPFFLLAGICECVCRPLGIEPPLYRRRVAFFTKDRMFNTSKMQTVLGFTPRSNQEGIVATARWYRDQGWI
jgi:nucleoside-diphosphate-sugar epimerase